MTPDSGSRARWTAKVREIVTPQIIIRYHLASSAHIEDLPRDLTHDLDRPRSWDIVNSKHHRWAPQMARLTFRPAGQIFVDLAVFLVTVLQSDKGVDSLASKVIVDANEGRLGNSIFSCSAKSATSRKNRLTLFNEGCFSFSP